jgi:DNA polymerase I
MLDHFREIVLCDYEFGSEDGDRQVPVCLVAWELRSGRKHRLWRDEFGATPPFPIGPDILFVAFLASAELHCHLALGWPMPDRVLDLFVEFKRVTNGLPVVSDRSLRGALAHYGLDAISAAEKREMRDLAIELGRTGRHPNPQERDGLLDYCESDVEALSRLLPAMAPQIDWARAIGLRGRYMRAVAKIEFAGVPIDVETLHRLRRRWDDIKELLIADLDHEYGVFENGSFRTHLFEQMLARKGIPWEWLPSGKPNLKEGFFRDQVKTFPELQNLHELRYSLSELRLNDLAVGRDGRNRTLLSVFRAKTSRNQPSNSKFIFGPATWFRGLIKPPPGYAVAYLDWSAQEVAIAAALSGDVAMQEAYLSGDPYLAFAKQSGAVPPDGRREDHEATRDRYKAVVLGIGYGMGELTLATRIGVRLPDGSFEPGTLAMARNLLRSHREVYRRFWEWSDRAVDYATQFNCIHTVYGWTLYLDADFNPRTLRNLPMQGNGAEMMRLACSLATERGIEVVAPVHDAIMICAPLDRIDQDVAGARTAMAEASRLVLGGFEIRTDAKIVKWPDRYMDKRGVDMWNTVMKHLDRVEGCKEAAA